MTLNPLQQIAKDGLVEFAKNREHKFAILLGPAGSGKTYTIAQVIKDIQEQEPNRHIRAIAPTHKACRILRKALQKHGFDLGVQTLSSFIGKAPATTEDPDEEGNARWNVSEGGLLEKGSILIGDEVSMYSLEEMKSVQKIINRAGAQLILCGDFCQLKPVKGQSIEDVASKIPVRFVLSEVMRSGSQGIIAMSKSVRTTGRIDLDAVDNKEVFIHNDENKFIRSFVETPEAVAIAYTNKRVSQLNDHKRKFIYGENVQAFMPGEKVILTESPLFIRRRSEMTGNYENLKVADNNAELIVERVGAKRSSTNPFAPDKPVSFYDLSLTNPETGLTFDAEGMTYDMYIRSYQPASEEVLANIRTFTTKLGNLDQKCAARTDAVDQRKFHLTEDQVYRYFSEIEANWVISTVRSNPKFMSASFQFDSGKSTYFPTKGRWSTLRGLVWPKNFFGWRSGFAILLYEHAFTSHKSQGSSFRHAYCDLSDLSTIRDSEDRQAATYVAVSRASETLHIRI